MQDDHLAGVRLINHYTDSTCLAPPPDPCWNNDHRRDGVYLGSSHGVSDILEARIGDDQCRAVDTLRPTR
ncbi:MAG: hypothetical protein HOH36_08655 [Acidimicrobiaceae bacterium]|nr:hypothetical protein [Acidimicrobiaceae bacterium]MBT5581845.1 hypothetical protein [Acidimicrobiaceae bacterium]MBT5850489.1 hypothetical protein [Acidimicrobiaceae bacterium]